MRTELRAMTRDAHRRVEQAAGLGRPVARARYLRFVARMYGFVAPLEPALRDALAALGLDPVEGRRAHLLERDLRALGVASDRVPWCDRLPDVAARPRALGCLYVLEGQALGARVLVAAVAQDLGLAADAGAAFLSAQASSAERRWREIVAALDAHGARHPEHVGDAVAGARDTFERLGRWLEAP